MPTNWKQSFVFNDKSVAQKLKQDLLKIHPKVNVQIASMAGGFVKVQYSTDDLKYKSMGVTYEPEEKAAILKKLKDKFDSYKSDKKLDEIKNKLTPIIKEIIFNLNAKTKK